LGLSDILNSLTDQYRTRYFDMANTLGLNGPTGSTAATQPTPEAATQQPAEPARDAYLPSSPTGNANRSDTANFKNPNLNPDGTYYYQRQSTLDYSLDLQFDLAAISQTAQQLSDGNTVGVDLLAAAGFGLSADMAFEGQQVIETNVVDSTVSKTKEKNSYSAQQVSQFAFQSRNFAMQSGYRESTDVARSLKVNQRDNYMRSVNKFALRYSLDNSFSFSFANKFNVQTREVSETIPESLSDYLTSAGNLAESGSSEMMAAFFGTVDQYLAQAEQTLTANAGQSFDMAAEELGFTGGLVDSAKDNLLGTIESFFDRVDNALAGLESFFVGSPDVALPGGGTTPIAVA